MLVGPPSAYVNSTPATKSRCHAARGYRTNRACAVPKTRENNLDFCELRTNDRLMTLAACVRNSSV